MMYMLYMVVQSSFELIGTYVALMEACYTCLMRRFSGKGGPTCHFGSEELAGRRRGQRVGLVGCLFGCLVCDQRWRELAGRAGAKNWLRTTRCACRGRREELAGRRRAGDWLWLGASGELAR